MLQAERSFAHKIADVGQLKKPFDIIVLRGAQAFIVAIFYRPRKAGIYAIPLRNFIAKREQGSTKSISEIEAKRMGFRINV